METIGSGFKAMEAVAETKFDVEAVAETKLDTEAAAEAKALGSKEWLAKQRLLCTMPKPFPEF
jgi:hypothetical protein